MRPIACTLLCLVTCIGSAAALDLNQIPAGHRWVLHLDVQRALDGELGVWADQILAEPKARARIQLLEAVTGVQLRQDLSGITLSGVDGEEQQAMALIRGSFDPERIQTLAQAADGHSESRHREHTIHHWLDRESEQPKSQYGSLVGNSILLLAGSEAAIRRGLDVIDGKIPSLDGDPAFAALSQLDAAIIAGAATDMDEWQGLQPDATMLREVGALHLQIDEVAADLTLHLEVTAKQEEKAQQLQQIAQGLIALYGLGQHQQIDPAVQQLIQALEVSRDGSTVTVSTRMPVAELRRLAEQHQATQGDGVASP